MSILARGRLVLGDAPAGEASMVGWFGAAAALATMPEGIVVRPPDSMRLTAVAVLSPSGDRAPANLLVLHTPIGRRVNIDAARLLLYSGFTETPWPDFTRASGSLTSLRDAGSKWRTIPAISSRK